MKKIRKNTKIGGITALGSVSFMVGWLDGWMVGWLDTFFFSHSGPNPTIYPSFARKNLAPLGIRGCPYITSYFSRFKVVGESLFF